MVVSTGYQTGRPKMKNGPEAYHGLKTGQGKGGLVQPKVNDNLLMLNDLKNSKK